jgi:hypothetical protein
MNYAEPTDDQKAQIRALFGFTSFDESVSESSLTIAAKDDGYHIRAAQMYDYIEFDKGVSTLEGYQKIAAILGCTDGDEIERESKSGCETCDWGSCYEYTLRFWSKL